MLNVNNFLNVMSNTIGNTNNLTYFNNSNNISPNNNSNLFGLLLAQSMIGLNSTNSTQILSTDNLNKLETLNTLLSSINSNKLINSNSTTSSTNSNSINNTNNVTNSNISTSHNNSDNIVSLLEAQVGKKYVWGANGPNSFDCSGLTKYIYKNALGIDLPRVSVDQSKYGKSVNKSDLQVGDLVFFDTMNKGKVSHVGIYIGNNEFIHAANSKKGVIKSKLSGYYENKYVCARRPL